MTLNINDPPKGYAQTTSAVSGAELVKQKYDEFKEDWKKQSLCTKLTKLAYFYSIHYFRLNYYYYFDYNKYTSYKSFLWFIQEQDKIKS